jgi:hypothetical protein
MKPQERVKGRKRKEDKNATHMFLYFHEKLDYMTSSLSEPQDHVH